MKIIEIVKLVNKYLAGEQLTFKKMTPFLDAVIDDINSELNSTYPPFSSLELQIGEFPSKTDEYSHFPDHYIRSVVCLGAASKFYTTDEEGIMSAEGYEALYRQNLFYMLRDYIEKVPCEYRADYTGSVRQAEERYVENHIPFDFHIWEH